LTNPKSKPGISGELHLHRAEAVIQTPVFALSTILILLMVVGTLLFQVEAATAFVVLRNFVTSQFDWVFVLSANIFVVFCIFIAFSSYGRVRLGGDSARATYSYLEWLSMLFAAGMGIGLMFFGVLEPVTHALHPPLGIAPEQYELARSVGMAAAIYHWGLHAWAIYAVVGLSLAYFSFNKDLPLTLRSALQPLFGKLIWGPIGHVIDTVAVLATMFGLATSLAFGAEQIAGGLSYLFGIVVSNELKIVLIIGIMAIALVSVVAGLDKGVKRISALNMGLAACLMFFVIVTGSTVAIFDTMWRAMVDYLLYLPALSNWLQREDTAFLHDWTTFYWAWWISWSPFVGMFIARISYGRTLREFVTCVLILPTVIGLLWMSTFGGTALDQLFSDGYRGVAEASPELALFKMLEGLPLSDIVSSLSVVLIAIFFITSADSGALVMDTISAGGKLDTPLRQRIFWCVLTGLVAIALLLGGGMASMQALTISVGLPFCVILLMMCISLLKALREKIEK